MRSPCHQVIYKTKTVRWKCILAPVFQVMVSRFHDNPFRLSSFRSFAQKVRCHWNNKWWFCQHIKTRIIMSATKWNKTDRWGKSEVSLNTVMVWFIHTTACHDDVIKWKHFPCYWPFVRGIHRSPVNSPHKGQWRGASMFTVICVWINGSVSTREAGDLRRYRNHFDVIVMFNL